MWISFASDISKENAKLFIVLTVTKNAWSTFTNVKSVRDKT